MASKQFLKKSVALDSNCFDILLDQKHYMQNFTSRYKIITTGDIKREIINSKKIKLIDLFNKINPEIYNPAIFSSGKPKSRGIENSSIITFPFILTKKDEEVDDVALKCAWNQKNPNYQDAKLFKLAKIKNSIILTQDRNLSIAAKSCGVECYPVVDFLQSFCGDKKL